MLQFKFIGYLLVISDVHTVSAIFSKESQSDSNLIIDVPTFKDTAKAGFEKLNTSLGTMCTRRLQNLIDKKISMADAGKPGRVLKLTHGSDSEADSESDAEGEVGTASVRGVTGNVKKRLLGYQQSIVQLILAGFDDRIQNKPVAVQLREMFDFRRMPLQRNAEAHHELLTWSDDAVDKFLPEYFPEFDAFSFKCEALRARFYVRDNKDRFMQFKDPLDESKGRVLVLTGDGSIFEDLFSRSDVCSAPIPMFLHVADYMISFMWQSCCGERAGSHINITKSKGRTGLNDDTFNSLIFNTFNMPHLHEMDFAAFVKRWADEGHKMGTTKEGMDGDRGESTSKVVRRHLEQKTNTFLFKK